VPSAARVVVSLPITPAVMSKRVASDAREMRSVPTVFGLDVRQATRTLYAAGFQVSIARGTSVRTRPAAGTLLRVGSTVQLEMPRMESAK
jgi:cell division protein FtsI (penicillin-binding protein 3)